MKRVAIVIGAAGGLYWAYLCHRNYYIDEAERLLIEYNKTKDPMILPRLEILADKIETIMCHEEKGPRQVAAAERYTQLRNAIARSEARGRYDIVAA